MANSDKQYAVLGLGRFGQNIAIELSDNGYDVLAVDIDQEIVQDISENVRFAVKADVTDIDALKSLGLGNFDVAIVAIATNMDASIMATLLAKELGVKLVISKAQDDMHEKILKKIGADRVIFPEREMAQRIANNLMTGNIIDYLELSQDYSIVEIQLLPEWIGKSLVELDFRRNYGVNIVAVKRDGNIHVSINPNEPFLENDVVIAIGSNEDIYSIEEKRGSTDDNRKFKK